ncbi:putative lipoprotein [Collimonas arenae]|uniref:Putative lipoprotein n=1 Tax=Collimonas arenae TaxID=279058 RepID=A0A0A1FCT9_9BURK|nr:type VI secretion system lipoprotein TssJ [Collimonas arenae]AIY41494.1 putative lipoprotein [Collimonas arenae]
MRFTSIVAVCTSLILSGCGAWQAVSDTTVNATKAVFYKQVKVLNVDFKARDSLNPDEKQKPLSVVVRVYQLKDRKAFDTATYNDLLKNDKTVLAQDLLDSHGLVLNPGGAASLSQSMQADTQYVAVAVFFRDATIDANWRRVVAKKSLSADDPLKFELFDNELIAATDVPQERPNK